VDSASVASQFQDPQCPTATAALGPLSVSGTVSFNADKSYTTTETTSGSVVVTLPASCLTVNGVTLTCAQAAQAIQAADASTAPMFSSVSCTGTSGCACTVTVAPTTSSDSGTWSQSGTQIALMSTAGNSGGGDYCVQGNEIHLLTLDVTMPMGPMGTLKIAKDVVATRS
jgi:hypothetical protein